MAEVESEQLIGDLEVFVTEPMPLDQALKAISDAGGELAPAQRVAQARLVAPREHSLWQRGSRVAENLVYVPANYVEGETSSFVLWTSGRHSPIPEHASKATQANRKGEEFYVPKSDFEAVLKQARADAHKPAAERKVLFDRRVDNFEVATEKPSADQLMQFLFKGDLEAYVACLTKFRIPRVTVHLAGAGYTNKQKQPFARALWLRNIVNRSGLDGNYGDLDSNGRARGVRRVAPSGAAPNRYETIARKYSLTPDALGNLLEAASAVRKQ